MSQNLYNQLKNKVNFDRIVKYKYVGKNTDYIKDYESIYYKEGCYPSAIGKDGIRIIFLPFNQPHLFDMFTGMGV